MDAQQQNRPYLEPIQEESEQEDETGGSRTEDREEVFQSEVEMEEEVAQEEEEEEEEEDDDDVPLRVLRPRRLSRSFSTESFLQSRSADNHQGDLEESSVSDAVDLSDEAKSSWHKHLGNEEQAIGRGLRKEKLPTPELKKTRKKIRKKKSRCLFPPWVVELMVNIEEATTHRLVVESRSSSSGLMS